MTKMIQKCSFFIFFTKRQILTPKKNLLPHKWESLTGAMKNRKFKCQEKNFWFDKLFWKTQMSSFFITLHRKVQQYFPPSSQNENDICGSFSRHGKGRVFHGFVYLQGNEKWREVLKQNSIHKIKSQKNYGKSLSDEVEVLYLVFSMTIWNGEIIPKNELTNPKIFEKPFKNCIINDFFPKKRIEETSHRNYNTLLWIKKIMSQILRENWRTLEPYMWKQRT